MLDLLGCCTFQVTALDKAVITITYYCSTTFQMTNDSIPFEIFTVKNSCFTSIHNYGSVIL